MLNLDMSSLLRFASLFLGILYQFFALSFWQSLQYDCFLSELFASALNSDTALVFLQHRQYFMRYTFNALIRSAISLLKSIFTSALISTLVSRVSR